MIDFDAALRGWVNASSIVGADQPLAKGLVPRRLRSPGRACYATLTIGNRVDGVDAEGVTVGTEAEFTVYSPTDETSSREAGLALASALRRLSAAPVAVGSTRLLMAAPVSWPELVEDDSGEHRHIVRATVYAAPA